MSTQKPYSDSGLWWQWLIATAAGLGIGLFLVIPEIQGNLSIRLPFLPTVGLSSLLAMGLVGFFQALVIRSHFTTWRLWILATLVGWIGFLALSTYADYYFSLNFSAVSVYGPFVLGNPIMGIQLGSMVGVFQWLILIGKVEDASWWIPISAIAYAIGLPIAAQSDVERAIGSVRYGNPLDIRVLLTTGKAGVYCGIAVGAISGLGLIWLLHRRIIITPPSAEN